MALIGLLDEAQVESYMRSILNNWVQNDGNMIRFGGTPNAQIGWDAGYMQGPNPYTGMWSNAPSFAYSDPNVDHKFIEDFHRVDEDDDWTRVDVNAGTALAIRDELNGIVYFTTNAAINSSSALMWGVDTWALEIVAVVQGALWFEARWKINVFADTYALMGLIKNDGADPLGDCIPALGLADRDGVFFAKNTPATADLNFVCQQAANQTIVAAIGTLVDDTYITTGFYWNGIDTVFGYVDGVLIGEIDTNIPNELIAPCFALRATVAGGKTMDLDYIKIIQLRS